MSGFKTGDVVTLICTSNMVAAIGATARVQHVKERYIIVDWCLSNPLHLYQKNGAYLQDKFRHVTSQIMEIGKTYTSNASCVNRKVVCIGYDDGRCVIRGLQAGHNYENVVGQVGKGMYNWTEYHKPVVSTRYTSVATSQWAGDHDVWCINKEPHHNIKGTFHDTVLAKIEGML